MARTCVEGDLFIPRKISWGRLGRSGARAKQISNLRLCLYKRGRQALHEHHHDEALPLLNESRLVKLDESVQVPLCNSSDCLLLGPVPGLRLRSEHLQTGLIQRVWPPKVHK